MTPQEIEALAAALEPRIRKIIRDELRGIQPANSPGYTIPETAKIMRRGKSTVARLIASRELRIVRVARGVFIPESAIRVYYAIHTEKAAYE